MMKQSKLFLAAMAVSAVFATSARADEVPAEAVKAPPASEIQAPTTRPVESPAPVEDYKKMGWGGIGFRLGFLSPSMTVDKVPLIQHKVDDTIKSMNAVREMAGMAQISKSDMDLKPGMILEFTPVLHMGGDGYFWKFEFPLNFAPSYTSYGLGMYPINYGYYIESIGLFPYLSIGGVVSYATASKVDGVDVSMGGAVIQARVAVGAKYYLTSYLPVSVDIGFSPWSGGGMADTKKLTEFTDAQKQIESAKKSGDPAQIAAAGATANSLKDTKPSQLVRGGIGSMFNLTFGLEWL